MSLAQTIADLEAALPSESRELLGDFTDAVEIQAAEIARQKEIISRIVEICDRSIPLDAQTAAMALRLIRDAARESDAR